MNHFAYISKSLLRKYYQVANMWVLLYLLQHQIYFTPH